MCYQVSLSYGMRYISPRPRAPRKSASISKTLANLEQSKKCQTAVPTPPYHPEQAGFGELPDARLDTLREEARSSAPA